MLRELVDDRIERLVGNRLAGIAAPLQDERIGRLADLGQESIEQRALSDAGAPVDPLHDRPALQGVCEGLEQLGELRLAPEQAAPLADGLEVAGGAHPEAAQDV